MIKNERSHSVVGLAKNLFDKSIKNMKQIKSPRAVSYIILGCIYYLEKFSGASDIKKVLSKHTQRLFKLYSSNKTEDWLWFENSVTYTNARLSQALLSGGKCLKKNEYITSGLESLEWLFESLYNREKNYLSLIGNEEWFIKGKTKSKFDQQPVEIPALIDACYEAYLITHDNKWIRFISIAFNWFLGNNDRQETMIDFSSGACYDGLTLTKVNENQGAESTLSWLASLYKMIDINQQLQIHSNSSPKKTYKEKLTAAV